MVHPDNKTPIDRAIVQTERLLRECFRMATRLVMEESGADSFESREAKEKSQALIPIVALDIKSSVQQFIGIEQVPQNRVDESQDSADRIILALKMRNDLAAK